MKTSSLIISLLCLTVTKAQDNQDNPPDGNQTGTRIIIVNLEELRKAVSESVVVKSVQIVTIGLSLVLFHFLSISLANLLQISYSSWSLVSVPLVGNVILTNYLQVGKFVCLFDRVSDGSPLVHFVLSGLFLVLNHFLMICLANLLQISFPTIDLVISETLVRNVIFNK